MAAKKTVRHRVALYGRVTDAQSGKPLSSARVEIVQASAAFADRLALLARQAGGSWPALAERPDRTRTAPDGHYHFLDLPAGTYMLRASLPAEGSRHGVAIAQATLTAGPQGVSRAAVDFALPATTVQGRVTNQHGDPLVLAEVGLRGGAERAFTDGQGSYRLAGLETGPRTLVISAPGYQLLARAVALGPPGSVATVDLTLQPAPP
jgi:Carboxypeptidase regulatory-like domain